MKDCKFWNGVGVPVRGEVYFDKEIYTEWDARGTGLCYAMGEGFNGSFSFQVLYMVEPHLVEEFTYNSCATPNIARFSVATMADIASYYNTLSHKY